MPPRLRIECPEWAGQDPDDAGAWENDTPRSPLPPGLPGSLPSSPSARKTKSRAARAYHRISSLKDAKVLVVTDMHRSESALDPALFQYHQHFESPWQLVGKTHLSEVFRVRHRASGDVFAVKRSRRRFRSKLQRERCLREIRAVAALPAHPNIVNQYRAWQEGGHFYIQMDFCEGGTLAQRAHKACAAGTCMPDEALWAAACQAAQGLAFLHSHGVMHLDIKPDNIYLSSAGLPQGGSNSSSSMPCCEDCGGGTWRIGDFGLAVARGQDGSMDWEEGDGDYVAPELLQAGGEPSERADIFSLGASLYECATGRKLPRSEGWGEGSAEAIEVPHRPPAFVALLRAMLQANPAQRPTAQQVIDVVAREQPAIAAAAAEAVTAAAAAAAVAEAAAAAARAASMAAQQGTIPAGSPLAPSPFQQMVEGSSPVRAGEPAATPAAAPAAADASQFSFDVPPANPGGSGFTPSQPLRPHNRRSSSSGAPGTVVKGTPVGRTRLGGASRWAPALSPLISEGALTPGALASLAGLTPQGSKGAPTPTLFGAHASSGSSGSGGATRSRTVAATPLDACRPAPLQLPQSAAQAVPSAGTGSMPLSGDGTGDSRDGWRLSRRDIISPDSDVFNGSHSESDYSFSCGTGRTLSDMDFADAVSPMSQELHLSFAAGATPSTGTPESLPCQDGEGSEPPSTGLRLQQAQQGEQGMAGALRQPSLQHAASLQQAPSLAWDLHTSPEFLMQLPPGSPASLSRSSSLDDCASLPPSRAMSVRRFPTLDSWGSALDVAAAGGASKPHTAGMPRCDSLTGVAAQRFTNTFGASAGEAERGGAPMPPLVGRGLRKRQHSSRRTLMAALSRDNSVASSMDGMQPMGKQQRHVADPDSAGPSPHRPRPMADMPSLPLRPLPRSGSLLGRDAAAAATAVAMAEAAAKALAAAVPPDALRAAGTPTAQQAPPFFACGGEHYGSYEGRPPSPLHARMTCMKLRDTD